MGKRKHIWNHGLPVLTCWHCSGVGMKASTSTWEDYTRCFRCNGTGKLFWADGYGYPYTPEDERLALKRLSER